jgi:hypothetical protein
MKSTNSDMTEALRLIADLSPVASDVRWDAEDGYAAYRTLDGKRESVRCYVGAHNSGDSEDFGYEMGLWAAAKIARKYLVGFDPAQARLEAAVVEAALATHTKRAYANQEFDTALYNLEAHIAAQEAGA